MGTCPLSLQPEAGQLAKPVVGITPHMSSLFPSQEAQCAFSCQQENTQDGQNEPAIITMLVSAPGLMVSTAPCQPNITIRDTNVGYILLNRLIALLQNAVCILLTHLEKFLVTQPRCNRGKNDSLQAGTVGWNLQLSLWGLQKCSEKLIQFLCCFL